MMSNMSIQAEVHLLYALSLPLSTEPWICRCSNIMLAVPLSSSSAYFWSRCLLQRSEYDQIVVLFYNLLTGADSYCLSVSLGRTYVHLFFFAPNSGMSQTSFSTGHLLFQKPTMKIIVVMKGRRGRLLETDV